jgi:hypothetical protein
MTTPDRQQPRGVGIYLRRISESKYGSPAEAAARCADHGLSFVCLPATWQERGVAPDMNPSELEERYAGAFHARGIDVHVWGYPDRGHEAAFARELVEHARRMAAAGVLVDAELPFKGHPEDTRRLMQIVIDELDEGLGLGVTSYGRLDWHKLEALEEYGWLSPQVYTVSAEAARRSIQSWRTDESGLVRKDAHIVASVPTFGPNAEGQLGAYLGAIEDLVEGVIAWSWPSTSELEWKTLGRWAERFASRRAA